MAGMLTAAAVAQASLIIVLISSAYLGLVAAPANSANWCLAFPSPRRSQAQCIRNEARARVMEARAAATNPTPDRFTKGIRARRSCVQSVRRHTHERRREKEMGILKHATGERGRNAEQCSGYRSATPSIRPVIRDSQWECMDATGPLAIGQLHPRGIDPRPSINARTAESGGVGEGGGHEGGVGEGERERDRAPRSCRRIRGEWGERGGSGRGRGERTARAVTAQESLAF